MVSSIVITGSTAVRLAPRASNPARSTNLSTLPGRSGLESRRPLNWMPFDPANKSLEILKLKEGRYELHCAAEEKGKLTSLVFAGLEFDWKFSRRLLD